MRYCECENHGIWPLGFEGGSGGWKIFIKIFMKKTKIEYWKTYNFLSEHLDKNENTNKWDEIVFILRKMMDIKNGFDFIFSADLDSFRNSVNNLVIKGILIDIRVLQDLLFLKDESRMSYKMKLYREFANMEAHRFFDNNWLSWSWSNGSLEHFELLNYRDFIEKYSQWFYKWNDKFPKKIYELLKGYIENCKIESGIGWDDYSDEWISDFEMGLWNNFLKITYWDFIDIDHEFYECAKKFFQK